MMWKPSYTIEKKDEKQEPDKAIQRDMYEIPRHPTSDMTQFVVASTTIDTQKLDDPRFKSRHENEILSIDKFAPLSNIDLTDQLLTRLLWMDMIFAQRMGMKERAERKSLEILRIYNESRGRYGEFQKALITTRQELTSRHKQETDYQSRGRFGFARKKKPKEPMPHEYQPQIPQGGFPQ